MENKKNKSNIFNMKYFNVILYMSLIRFYNIHIGTLYYTLYSRLFLFSVHFHLKKIGKKKFILNLCAHQKALKINALVYCVYNIQVYGKMLYLF